MKRKILLLVALVCMLQSYAQITFRGCTSAVLGAQDFVLSQTGTVDDGGIIRNTYESTVIDFTQSCPAGNCEVRIIWNTANTRWEIQLDNGNDGPADLPNPDYDVATLYFNTSPSEPNPPSLDLGDWEDNLGGSCGGTLTQANSTLTGSVQDQVLSINDNSLLAKEIRVYPNPAKDKLSITSEKHLITKVEIFTLLGKKVKTVNVDFERVNVIGLASNIYLLKIETSEGNLVAKKLMIN